MGKGPELKGIWCIGGTKSKKVTRGQRAGGKWELTLDGVGDTGHIK